MADIDFDSDNNAVVSSSIALSLKALGIDEVSTKANYDSKLQIGF